MSTHSHKITINRHDGVSKYGRPKRTFQAVCSCGWEDRWEPAQRWSAVENGDRHVIDHCSAAPAQPVEQAHDDEGGAT